MLKITNENRISRRIDDIQDDSLARDGVPVVHKVFGSPSTIAAANFGYFLAMKKAAELGHPDVSTLYIYNT